MAYVDGISRPPKPNNTTARFETIVSVVSEGQKFATECEELLATMSVDNISGNWYMCYEI
jgi:hypothetical protein